MTQMLSTSTAIGVTVTRDTCDGECVTVTPKQGGVFGVSHGPHTTPHHTKVFLTSLPSPTSVGGRQLWSISTFHSRKQTCATGAEHFQRGSA